MFKLQKLDKKENYNIITFTDGLEAYGAIVIIKDESLYLEFMEFKGEELISITEDETPEEYHRLEEKYINDLIDVIDRD